MAHDQADQFEARITNGREDMPLVAEMVERFGARHGIGRTVLNDLNVALDEWLSNIIAYAYEPNAQGEIRIRLAYRPGEVVAEIEDSGRAFDPLQVPPPNLSTSLQARKVGGLGIYLVRKLMDEVSYARVDGKNRLEITKKLAAT